MKISNGMYGFLLALPGALFLTLLVAIPIGILITLGFLRYDYIHPIRFYGLRNFEAVLIGGGSRVFWLSLQNAIIYSSAVTLVTLLVGLILALSASRVRRFSGLFRTLVILPWAVPLVVSGLVWRWMLDPGAGVYNYLFMQAGLTSEPLNIFADPNFAMIGVVFADSWVKIPFMFIIILAGIKSIPQELYESARVDGAHMIHTLRYITLPLARRSILVGVLITSMFSFRTIDVIWSMTKGGPGRATYVIGFDLIDYLVQYQDMGAAAAVAILMLLIIAAFAGTLVYYIAKE